MNDENITVYIMDPDNPPPLTAEQEAMLEALGKMPDSEIDYSDIPKHDFEKMPMHRVNPGAGPKGRAEEKAEKETAGA